MVRKRNVKGDDVPKKKKIQVSEENIDDSSFSAKGVLKFFALFIGTLYLLVPIIMISFPKILEQVVFMNLYLGINEKDSLTKPTSVWNLSGVANFQIELDDVTLGAWHVLPHHSIKQYDDDHHATGEEIESRLKNAEHVIIYHHGNGFTRASGGNGQRNKLYKLLQSLSYHIIAYDYRGYGDSTGWPSEEGLVRDSVAVFEWVRKRANPDTHITLWGHSLGTSIVTLSADKMFKKCASKADDGEEKGPLCPTPSSVILESPFSSVRNGARDSLPAQLFTKIYPKLLFDYTLETCLQTTAINLASEDHIEGVKCPILILHAEDDFIINLDQSNQLYEKCEKSGLEKHGKFHFVRFKGYHGYNHMDIHKAPQLPELLREFFSQDKDSKFKVVDI